MVIFLILIEPFVEYHKVPFWDPCFFSSYARATISKGKTGDAIHSTKIQTGPTGKRGPPQKVDQFFRNFSGWTERIHWVVDRNIRKFSWMDRAPAGLSEKDDSKEVCYYKGQVKIVWAELQQKP